MRFVPKFALLTLLIVFSNASNSNADIVLNVTPNGTGGTTLEIMGTGTVIAEADADVGAIGAALLTGSFLSGPVLALVDLPDPAISIGGQDATEFVILGGVATGSDPAVSNINIAFGDQIPVGSNLSDLDGTYDIDFNFNSFVLGQYNLTSPFGGTTDVGAVTLNVGTAAAAAVPEPASGSILLLACAAQAMIRRKKR